MIKRFFALTNVTYWDRTDAELIKRSYDNDPIYRDGVPVPYTEFMDQSRDLYHKHHVKTVEHITRDFPRFS